MKAVTKDSVRTVPASNVRAGKVSKKRKKKKVLVDGGQAGELPKSPSPPETNGKKPKKKKRKLGKPHSSDAAKSPAEELSSSGAQQSSTGKEKRLKFQNSKISSLREKMLGRLSAARFRFINEELYTWDGEGSPVFAKDPKSFSAYHTGFKQQTKLWPINPIDVIIKSIKKLPNYASKVIADFGCGEAKLAHELSSNKVFSFDLVALNDKVTVADNANVKLRSASVDVAVHCLSLMSSKTSAYVKEANRVLKTSGVLKIAEVESRFDDVDKFIDGVCKFNFKLVKKDFSHSLFYFLDFEKLGDIGVSRKRKLPTLTLQPCLYKKR